MAAGRLRAPGTNCTKLLDQVNTSIYIRHTPSSCTITISPMELALRIVETLKSFRVSLFSCKKIYVTTDTMCATSRRQDSLDCDHPMNSLISIVSQDQQILILPLRYVVVSIHR